MKITFELRQALGNKQANLHNLTHFLLKDARLEVTIVLEDGDQITFIVPRVSSGRFVLDIGPDNIPDRVVGPAPPAKMRITRLSMDFYVDYSVGTTKYHLLKIRQDFSLRELPTNDDHNIDYALAPFSWTHSATSALRTANSNVHPLLDLSKLSKNLILMNALVVDLTELWDDLHAENWHYQFYKDVTPADKVTFKVFAHLGGNSFIWFGIIPSYLRTTAKVSPHVFYFPGDLGPKQNVPNEYDYLFRNPIETNASDGSHESFDGEFLLFNYLLPPVDDEQLDTLKSSYFPDDWFKDFIKTRRNVVGFEHPEAKPREIVILHWNIGGGLQRAFYGLSKKKPLQFLLLPQPLGRKEGNATTGNENGPDLKHITATIVDFLQTNTELLAQKGDDLVEKDKMVLSGYSVAGLDLWRAASTNIDHIKAIIGIEPNPMNPQGRDVIRKLLGKKIAVYIIGKHLGKKPGEKWPHHYRPDLPGNLLDQIDFLPTDIKMLKYPPNPQINDFVKFRALRVTDVNLDPFMLESEQDILKDLASRQANPITGTAAITKIFDPLYDLYARPRNRDTSYADIMYTHSFALNGGQEMTLVDPDNPYKKGIKEYKTFFQEAVDKIG